MFKRFQIEIGKMSEYEIFNERFFDLLFDIYNNYSGTFKSDINCIRCADQLAWMDLNFNIDSDMITKTRLSR